MNNREVVEGFLRKHSSWLRGVCYNLTQDHDDASDLLQDVCIKLLELKEIDRIRFGEDDINLMYVYNIAKSIFLNRIRFKKHLNPVNFEDLEESGVDIPEVKINENFEDLHADLVNSINEELEGMLKNEKLWFSSMTFKVYMESGKSFDELAKETRISKSTLWTTVNNMKKHLREKFEDKYKMLKDE